MMKSDILNSFFFQNFYSGRFLTYFTGLQESESEINERKRQMPVLRNCFWNFCGRTTKSLHVNHFPDHVSNFPILKNEERYWTLFTSSLPTISVSI